MKRRLGILFCVLLGTAVFLGVLNTWAEAGSTEPVTVLEAAPKGAESLPANRGLIEVQGEAAEPGQPEASAKAPDAKDESLRRQVSLDALDPAKLREIKAKARARLAADRALHEVNPADVPAKSDASKQRAATVSADSPGIAQKMKTLPIVAPPSAAAESNRQGDIERLTAERQKADNAGERDRLGLDLAAAHVGAGENDKALAIYEDLAQHAALDGVRQTARENIQRIGGKPASNSAGASTK